MSGRQDPSGYSRLNYIHPDTMHLTKVFSCFLKKGIYVLVLNWLQQFYPYKEEIPPPPPPHDDFRTKLLKT